jgi:hypothetical protein
MPALVSLLARLDFAVLFTLGITELTTIRVITGNLKMK